MNETKKCPYCGNEILAIAKKCRFCGKWLTENGTSEQIEEKTSPANGTIHAGNYDADSIRAAIVAFKKSANAKSRFVYFEGNIPEKVMARHKKHYAQISPDENVLMVVNSLGIAVEYLIPITGVVLTDKYLHYRCRSGLCGFDFWGRKKGKIPLEQISRADIEEIGKFTNPGIYRLKINKELTGTISLGGLPTEYFGSDACEEIEYIFTRGMKKSIRKE